eukprot:CAMPEP_0195155928 /NCGR_PEP_ID=MMETSP0448-20130528/184407_1 /TAXON_ID=66468 /ORGANISM="Heterocapsa triquestra, Strain CCMP 448" /LENGTH=66 /DNA_ID=CAMNT_0040194717 /DNA_START=82 /DNA_END=282 /DNA_ORIENTATION=-
MVVETVALTVAVVCGVTCFLMAAEHDQEEAMKRAVFIDDAAEKNNAAGDDSCSEGSTLDTDRLEHD